MPKINIARILEQRECPGCANNKPGTKGDCGIKLHIVYGQQVSEAMDAWMQNQVMTGVCKQRRPR